MGRLLERIARSWARGESLADTDLLASFVQTNDQAAFESLVWRHAEMVLGVCQRITGDKQWAEDAFQATFLVLARKAKSLRGTNVAGWLFRVAHRVSLRARRKRSVEVAYPIESVAPATMCPAERAELLAIVDEEVARLPERFRLPVVLCYLGGYSTEDAARQIGCPRGTVLSRLTAARSRLAARLTKRGVTVPATLLVAAIPSSLSAVLVPAAIRLAFRPSATGHPVALANGVITTMAFGKTIVVTGVFVLATGLLSGLGWTFAGGIKTAQEPKGTVEDSPASVDRDEKVSYLKQSIEKLREEIAGRQKAIEILTAASTVEKDLAKRAEMQKMLATMDREITTAKKEILAMEAKIEILKPAGKVEDKADTPKQMDKIKQCEKLYIRAVPVFDDAPVDGVYMVGAKGEIVFGPKYGGFVKVEGLAPGEAAKTIQAQMRHYVKSVEVSVVRYTPEVATDLRIRQLEREVKDLRDEVDGLRDSLRELLKKKRE